MQLGLQFCPPDEEAIVVERVSAQPLRPYQQAAVDGIHKQLEENRSTLLVLPTGCGKTRVFTEVAQNWKNRVLVTAHRDELLQQARKRLEHETGEHVGLEQATFRGGDERIVVGSIQTLCQPDRLSGWKKNDFGLLIIDEAHHAPSVSYRRVIDHFEGAKVLGVTATPDRADEKAMGRVFESVAHVYEIEDAIADGWLAPIRVTQVFIEAIKLAAVRTVAGDLNQGDLDAAMAVEEALHGVVNATIEQAGERRTLVFTTSVANAKRMAEIFNRHKPESARSVDGGTPTDLRRHILAQFSAGAFQYLVNCAIATEGFDCPEIACVAMARPTKSRALFAQMVGRGLRIHPSKADCMILEFTGNAGKHHLASSCDILGGRYEDDEVEEAKKLIERKPGMRADEALEKAHKEAEARKAEEAARRAQLTANVQYSTRAFNPFEVLHMKAAEDGWSDRFGGAHATDKQVEFLRSKGCQIPANLTKQQASRLIGNLMKRRELGLCTFKQVANLEKYGIPAIDLSFRKAGEVMDAIVKAGWKLPAQETLDNIIGRERSAGEDA